MTRRPLSRGKKLAFAAVTALVAAMLVLGLAEGTLRLLGYPQGLVRSFNKLWNRDAATRDAVVGLFRPDFSGRVAYPPELAYDVSFNEAGLRGPPLGDGPKLLLLGDSVTFGYHVGDGETYPVQLQAMLEQAGSPLEAVNAGCGHFTISDERRYLSERLLRLEPRVVVLQFCSNDVLPGELQRDPTLYETVLQDDDAPNALRESALGEVLLRGQLALKRWRKGPLEELGVSPETEVPEQAWETYARELRLLRDALRERGVPLLMVSLPELSAVKAEGPSRVDARLAEIAAGLEIPFRSGLEAFRQAEEPVSLYLYPLDPHPSAAGHAVLARIVRDLLAQEGLLAQGSGKSSE